MNKKALLVALALNISWAGDVICAPYFELNNLGNEFKTSTLKLLKNKIEEDNTASMIIPMKDTARSVSLPIEENLDWAKQNKCTHLLLGTLTRLGESVSVNVKYVNTSNASSVFQKSYKASDPDDLDPILSQLAAKISQPGYTSVESIYDVSNTDARALRKKRSSNFYGASIGAQAFTQNIKLYQVSTLVLWDNRTFMGEADMQWGFNLEGESQKSNFLAIRFYKPLSTLDNSWYLGGGLGFGVLTQGEDEYDYRSGRYIEAKEAGGMLLSGAAGYLIGRTTDFRMRGQVNVDLITATFDSKGSFPIGMGFKLLFEYGN